MPEPEAIFEVFDKPRLRRRVWAGSTICLGIAISFAALWYLHVRVVAQHRDVVFLAIGLFMLAGGCKWWFLPLRPPRLMLRADGEGLTFPKDYPVTESSAYETIPWARIRSIRSVQLDEGYGLEFEASFTAKALAALKEKYGAQYWDSMPTEKRSIRVVGFRREAQRTANALQRLIPGHTDPAEGASGRAAPATTASRRNTGN